MTAVSIDTRDVLPLLDALRGVDRELRQNSNRRLREAAGECSRGLVGELQSAGSSSSTPQAALVARTARVASDRIPKVTIGGNRRVGHRGTPAGRLLWGSENGGVNFPGSGRWIAPTVDAYSRGAATRTYQAAVAGILRDAGVL